MSTAPVYATPSGGHLRAFGRFVLAGLFFLLARGVAHSGAKGLAGEEWLPLVEQGMLVFLLVVGYACAGFVLSRQTNPVRQQGLWLRKGWFVELGMGVAAGWAIAVVCVLPLVLFGGIALGFSFSWSSLGWLFADGAFFALATLALQVAFRGYPFQQAIEAVGELPAVLVVSVLAGILQAWLPGASRSSMAVSITLGLLLSMAYLRTRALWVPWGLHFGWLASRALLFGLPVSGTTSHSPLVQGEPIRALSLAGYGFGLDGSWFSCVVMLIAMPFVYRATRDLSFEYNAPVLIPGGIPVDLDAAAQRQHESATRPETPEVKPLVQILPAMTPPPMPAPDLDLPRLDSRDGTSISEN